MGKKAKALKKELEAAGEFWSGFVLGEDGSPKLPDDEERKVAKRVKKANKERAASLGEGAAGLDAVYDFLGRFIVFPSDEARRACVLWAAHTHVYEVFPMTPRAVFTSPVAGSGKTNAMDFVTKFAPRVLLASHMTPSLIARTINADPDLPTPTLGLDEYDTVFGRHAGEATEALRGIINAGAYPTGNHPINVPNGRDWEQRNFPTFAPMALAGLHELPDTTASRSIVIRMRRKLDSERVEIYRIREHEPEHLALRDRLGVWVTRAVKRMHGWPDMPDELGGNRNEQKWEPLVAIADLAGGEWPRLAREAAVALTRDEAGRAEPLGVRLLADVRRVFGARDRIRSVDLLGELVTPEESQWKTFGGTGLDSRFLSKTFAEFGIVSPHPIRFDAGTGTQKGWYLRDFADAFARYLPEAPTPPVTLPFND